MKKIHMIDPPSGWKYGFPKPLPKGVSNTIAWLLEQGYPQHEIDACGDHFYCRHWQTGTDDDTISTEGFDKSINRSERKTV